MPQLDKLFARPGVPAFSGAQCWDAKVTRIDQRGIFVTLPSYDRNLAWGPCLPAGATVEVGDRVAVLMNERGDPWLVGAGGGTGGGEDPNIDGGAPDSIYGGGLPGIDGGPVS